MCEWKKNHLLVTFGKKTFGKSKECFILNALWQRLCLKGIELEPISQQLVRGEDGSYHLLDLFFPAIKLGIECDEHYHKREDQKIKDRSREEKIVRSLKAEEILLSSRHLTDFEIHRIDAEMPLNEIYQRIDGIISIIEEKISKQEREASGRTAWLSNQEKWKKISNKKQLSVNDDVFFQTIAEAYKLFIPNSNPPARKGFFKAKNSDYYFWFPQLAVLKGESNYVSQNSKGWLNLLSVSDYSITETNLNFKLLERGSKFNYPRITFVKAKDPLGIDRYHFAGIYQFDSFYGSFKRYKRVGSEISWEFTDVLSVQYWG